MGRSSVDRATRFRLPVRVDDIASHQPHCIGCGADNPGSIGLRFVADGRRVRARCTFDERHEGAPGFVHGGFVGREMTIEAWAEHVEGRKLRLAAALREGETTIAEGRALFVEVPLEHFARGGDLPDALKARWNDLPY
jgi:hypothetical protein